MILDPLELKSSEMYRYMIGTITPRPIAFISTLGREGRRNLAPFSYFNAISTAPPLVGVSFSDRAGDPKDTLRNIRETGEFVVNLVAEPLLEAMVRSSGEWPRDTDEFNVAGLTAAPSHRVKPPRVAESPVHFECRLHREIPLGNSVFVVGEVLLGEIRDELFTDGRVDPMKLKAVGRLGGESYSLMRQVVNVPRPRVSREGGNG